MPSVPKALASCALLLAAFAALMKAADRVPSLLAGTPHGARVYDSVAGAERAIGAPIWLPTSFPPSLAWPPSRVDAWPGPPTSVAVRVLGLEDRVERLTLIQSVGSPAPPPAELLPRVDVLMTIPLTVGGRPATLTRALAPDGRLLHDLSWDEGTRHLTLRYAGPVEELLSIAASLDRVHS